MFRVFYCLQYRIASVLLPLLMLCLNAGFILLGTHTVEAQALLQAQPMSKAQAAKAGYKRQIFSFNAPQLDFETYIPQKAEVKILPHKTEPIPQGQIGRVLPIGQIHLTKDGIAYESVIFSYYLRSPPAAYHTCMWYLTNDDYHIIHAYAPNPLTEAQLLGIKLGADGKPETAAVAYCYSRGDTLTGNYFMAQLPEDERLAEAAVISLRDMAADFVANMRFSDNRPIQFSPEQTATRIVELNSGNLQLFYPKALDVTKPENNASTLPYELYFTQKLQSGRPFGYLLFAVHAISGPNREEAFRNLADAYVSAYLDMQIKSGDMPNGTRFEFLENNTVAGYAQTGIAARSYRYKLVSKEAPEQPTLFQISLVRNNNRLYVIYYHSLRTDFSSAGGYFTGSSGDVAYDMLRDSLRKFLTHDNEGKK